MEVLKTRGSILNIFVSQVPRDYAAFEKLQQEILASFPELKLPPLPRKFHLFMSESDIDERMVSFDCIMKLIARHQDMCVSSAMLHFLGFNLLADKKYYKVRTHCMAECGQCGVVQYVLLGYILDLHGAAE